MSSIRKIIMIIDDEQGICDLFCEILNKEFATISFNNFTEAISYCEEEEADIAICDYTIPDNISPVEAITRIRELNKDIKIVLTSGDPSNLDEFDKKLIDETIIKPITIEKLLTIVRSF